MNASRKTRMQTFKAAYTFDYPVAIEAAEAQEKVFWRANEIEVAKDLQDMKVNMSEAAVHGVITTLKLFTLYELVAGNEYWGGRFKRMFPRHDWRQMASTFSYVELGIHAPFYNKINKLLNLDTDDFYTDYVNNPVLKARMEFIDRIVNHKNDLISVGAFSMVEGGILYSAFAFLKHFQTGTKNELLNVVRGIDFSVRDENLHSEGGARAFLTLLNEQRRMGIEVSDATLQYRFHKLGKELYEHESEIIRMIFEKGEILGITAEDMRTFVKSRINLCLQNLGIPPLFSINSNPIADWFYNDVNAVKLGDFFVGVDSSYNRNWSEARFAWKN